MSSSQLPHGDLELVPSFALTLLERLEREISRSPTKNRNQFFIIVQAELNRPVPRCGVPRKVFSCNAFG
jgi:hypothetical protein